MRCSFLLQPETPLTPNQPNPPFTLAGMNSCVIFHFVLNWCLVFGVWCLVFSVAIENIGHPIYQTLNTKH